MRKSSWQNLKTGDWIKYGKHGTPRKILKASRHDGKTGCITLKQIGYSYLGNPKAGRTVVYVSCDCRMFNKILSKKIWRKKKFALIVGQKKKK
jgi:hypothetical protein